jgi:hypothetical protein
VRPKVFIHTNHRQMIGAVQVLDRAPHLAT